jgi:hypothetical protein
MEVRIPTPPETDVTATLPTTISRYFAAQNAHDVDALVACFASNAVVHDEGADIVGTDAIRAWKEESSKKYRVTVEPLESREEGNRTVVVARVTGTFPGSPANLTYHFGIIEDGLIGTLEIG